MADVSDWIKTAIEIAGAVGACATAYLAVIVRNIITTCNFNIQAAQVQIMRETRELVETVESKIDLTNIKVGTAETELASHIVQDQERFNANTATVARIAEDLKDVKRTIERSTNNLANLINRNFNERHK